MGLKCTMLTGSSQSQRLNLLRFSLNDPLAKAEQYDQKMVQWTPWALGRKGVDGKEVQKFCLDDGPLPHHDCISGYMTALI